MVVCTPRSPTFYHRVYLSTPISMSGKRHHASLSHMAAVQSRSGPNIRNFSLLSRGWAYQERRVSRRIVHFARNQTYWECRHCFESADVAGIMGEQPTQRLGMQPMHTMASAHWSGDNVMDWKKTVMEFTCLQLTFSSDRLPAIAALAERMMHLRGRDDTYIAGLWQSSILSDILWYKPTG